MNRRNFRIFILLQSILFCFAEGQQVTQHVNSESDDGLNENNPNANPSARALFSPRVDYNEWLPVGRADPLKNDPTFDYSPPVLDRVRYWGDTNKEKKDILVLGVPSKRTFHKQSPSSASTQNELHASNRRNFLMSEPATILMPPPMPTNMDYNNHNHGSFGNPNAMMSPNSYWTNQHGNDALTGESGGFLTVIKPKFVKNSNYQGLPSMTDHMETSSNSPPSYVKAAQSPLKKTQWLHSLLQREVSHASTPSPLTTLGVATQTPPPSTPQIVMSYSPSMFETHSMHTDHFYNDIKHHHHPHQQPNILPMIMETTTHFTPTTVPTMSMNANELYGRYRKPTAPIKEPLFLIIQGHSKVKTYGPKPANITEKHVPKMVPVASTKDPVVSHVVSEDEKGNAIVMHLHKIKSTTTEIPHYSLKQSKTRNKPKQVDKKTTAASSTMGNLLSLLDTSFGGFFLNDNESTSPKGSDKVKPTKKVIEKIVEIEKNDIKSNKTNTTVSAVKS